MDAAEKRQRDLELLRKSRRALDEGELVDRHAPEPEQAERRQAPPQEGDPDVVMYRGKAIRRPGGGGGKPSGGGQRAGQFRGASAGGGSKAKSGGGSGGDVRAILERLNNLYKDGLITKSEYDRKRNQILDRM